MSVSDWSSDVCSSDLKWDGHLGALTGMFLHSFCQWCHSLGRVPSCTVFWTMGSIGRSGLLPKWPFQEEGMCWFRLSWFTSFHRPSQYLLASYDIINMTPNIFLCSLPLAVFESDNKRTSMPARFAFGSSRGVFVMSVFTIFRGRRAQELSVRI